MNFKLKNSDGKEIELKDLKSNFIVIYFYPKDNTSGCTLEAIDFTKNLKEFEKLNTKVIGISPDSEKSHCNFRDKHKLKIELLSDPDKKVIKQFEAWGKKSMYGREYEGVIRSTFILDKNKNIVFSWKPVRVKGHVEQVLNKIKELK